MDIVVVLEDGLRAGPAADAFLAALGATPTVTYTTAWAPSVSRFVSHGAILSGRYPTAIPLCAWPGGAAEAPWCTRLPAGVATLPSVLGIYDYHTALASTPKRPREIATIDEQFDDTLVDTSGLVVDKALAWWGAHADKPRFLLVTDELTSSLPEEQDHDKLLTAYNAAATEHGRALAPLLAGVRARPTWVFVTSAHGLSLDETTGTPSLPMGAVQHDILLERTLHVPLWGFGPAGGPWRVDDVVEVVDLFPTIARLARAMPPADVAGRDLFGKPDPARVALAEFGDMLAVRSARHLLMARLWLHGGSALDPLIEARLVSKSDPNRSFTLHDVVADPMQESDLYTKDPERAAQLYAAMVALRQGPGAPPLGPFSAEAVQAMRASGANTYW